MNRIKQLLLAALLGLVLSPLAMAESLPTRGTFEGTYHENRWGVGHFEFFIVTPGLLPRLKPFEGKRIRVEVTRGDQPINPGPAIMLDVGRITPLPKAPLEIALTQIPASAQPQQPFQLVCRLQNRGAQPLQIRNGDVTVRIRSKWPVANPTNASHWIGGYTSGQLATRAQPVQWAQALVKTSAGNYGNLHGASEMMIEPGDAFPLAVLFDEGLPGGEYELEVATRLQTPAPLLDDGAAPVTVQKWFRHDVNPETSPTPGLLPRVVLRDVSFVVESGMYRIRGVLAPASGQPIRVVQRGPAATAGWEGRVRATTDSGAVIALAHIAQPEAGPARLVNVPPAGLPWAIQFAKVTAFSTQAVQKVYLDLLTENGVETLAVTESFSGDPLAALPPFGPETDGVKLRLRPATATIRAGEALKILVQAVNVSGQPVCWWQTSFGDGRHNVIEVDSQAIRPPGAESLFVDGWAGAWTCSQPMERTIEIPAASFSSTPGKHTIRLVVQPQRGFYTNSNNEPIPLLRKRLTSNIASFTIQ